MPQVTRRHVLQTGIGGLAAAGIIPFAEWFGKYGEAQAQLPLTRYSAQSAQGSAMLAKYQSAVGAMIGRQLGDPCSWVFQWYTHWIPRSLDKTTLIATLDPSQRPLASEMWDTCQSHFGLPPQFFLPWHRMYVYFFERIVRAACGDPSFTLPYWDYTDPHWRALPSVFYAPPSGSLYRSNRNPNSNAGQPIDQGAPPGLTITLDCLTQHDYLPTGSAQGFCKSLNNNPHGVIHVLVGNPSGMGDVPTAAGDPIFWLHHCNIDRMWASWNQTNPNPPDAAWRDQTFVFADELCRRVSVKVSDFAQLDGLHYRYDQLLPVPRPAALAAIQRLRLVAAFRVPGNGPDPAPRGLVLRNEPVTVRLGAFAGQGNLELSLRTLARAPRVQLDLRNLQTTTQPGILYYVFLNLPAGASRETMLSHYVGPITFFNAERGLHAGMNMNSAHADEGEGPTFSFDVTDLVRRLGQIDQLSVTIAPAGQLREGAIPIVGNIELSAG
jgi:tyrosinase